MCLLALKKYSDIFLSCSRLSHSQHVRSFLCLWGSGPFLYFLMRVLLNIAWFSDLSESKDWFFSPFIASSTQKQDQSYLSSNTWDQESVTFLCRGSDRNRVRLCCPYDPHCSYSVLLFFCRIVTDNTWQMGVAVGGDGKTPSRLCHLGIWVIFNWKELRHSKCRGHSLHFPLLPNSRAYISFCEDITHALLCPRKNWWLSSLG